MKSAFVAAAAGLAAVASTASAQHVINVGTLNVGAGGAFVDVVVPVPNVGAVTGFSFSGNFVGTDPFSWASDMRMIVTAPNGNSVSIGGYDNLALSTFQWAFQGGGSNPPGFYASGPHDTTANALNSGGNYTLRFINDFSFNTAMDWNNVTVTLVPTPGAAALLGLGGLAVMRRRRR